MESIQSLPFGRGHARGNVLLRGAKSAIRSSLLSRLRVGLLLVRGSHCQRCWGWRDSVGHLAHVPCPPAASQRPVWGRDPRGQCTGEGQDAGSGVVQLAATSGSGSRRYPTVRPNGGWHRSGAVRWTLVHTVASVYSCLHFLGTRISGLFMKLVRQR